MRFLADLGARMLRLLHGLGRAAFFMGELLAAVPAAVARLSLVVRQIHAVGNLSLLIIVASGTAVGFVLALQMYYALVTYGATESLGLIVNLSLVRELGPVLAATMLAGRVVGEACFSRGGNCPNGTTVQYGAGSGAPCTFASACMHGTHVAGIAAGDDGTTFGVAPDADLLAIQVASFNNGNLVSWTSDQLAGLDWIYAQRTSFEIAAVNRELLLG